MPDTPRAIPALIVCRLIPLVSFNVINYAAGLMNISWWTFIWTTAIGIVPGTFFTILVTETLLSGSTAAAVLCISATLVAIVLWVWRRRRRRLATER
ncbi:MAG: VTT domain-containing protein [Reyranella sp.]|nr:VTT domain-containing protein [Reyranella sp.]